MDKPIDIATVASVYSGKAGKCCCGCSGKHYYAAAHREGAGLARGYAVEDAEVNDKQVRRVVALLNKHRLFTSTVSEHCFSLEANGRLYVVYLAS